MGFVDDELGRLGPLWDRMLEHPFLIRARDGELPDDTFHAWLRQDYVFVRAARRFVGILIGRAPEQHQELLGPVPAALAAELELFEERAGSLGVDVTEVEPGLVNHAYVQFLMATAHQEDYAGAFTVYFVAERAYHDSWKVVRPGLPAGHPWRPFVDNWAGAEFASFVDVLGRELDLLAESAGPATRTRMRRLFELTTRYEIAFWEMALRGAGWPGLEEGVAGTSGRAGGATAEEGGDE